MVFLLLLGIVLRMFFLPKRLDEYKDYLADQEYPAELVSQEFSRAAGITKNELLKPKVRDSKKMNIYRYSGYH